VTAPQDTRRLASEADRLADRANWPLAWIVDDPVPRSGQFNMAFDAALLTLGAARDFTVVRVYEWSEPTVTTGYFQVPPAAAAAGIASSAVTHAAESETLWCRLPHVRRLSGGGAILHDHEVTYSFVIPADHPVASSPSELYRIVHRAIIGLLQDCGVAASLRCEADRAEGTCRTPQSDNPFLCFLREDGNDIVHHLGPKIVGSSQRRRRQVVLQHGSVLLQRSKFGPALAGIADLSPQFQADRFRKQLGETIARALAPAWQNRDITGEEVVLIDRQLAAG
jgi:lipoate-protein ligase A